MGDIRLFSTTGPSAVELTGSSVQLEKSLQTYMEQNLEALLGAAASAWPEGQGPAQTLRFEPGRLTLLAPGWSEPQLAQFRERLRPGGWAVESSEGRISLSRTAAPGARS